MSAGNRGPRVSVIMPAFRVAPYIGEALDSVFAQTYTDYEVIVVNDGCPDTEALERALEPYLDRIVYLKQDNRGPSGARNTAIRVARGELLALLDADDTWTPDYLETQVGILDAHPGVDVVYPDAEVFGGGPDHGRTLMDLSPPKGEADFFSIVRLECVVTVSVVARKRAVVEAGLFDATLPGAEDFELWARMAYHGSKFLYHRKALLRYRRRAMSQSSDPLRQLRRGIQALEALGRNVSLDERQRKAVEETRRFFEAEIGKLEGKAAIERGDAAEAREGFRKANRMTPRRKRAAAAALLRVWPWLAMRVLRPRAQRPA